MKRQLRTSVKLGVFGLLVAGSFHIRYDLTVAGGFEVYPSHNADVRAALDGIIDSVLVEEGQHVDEGQVVARLLARQHRANLRKIDAELREQRANLARLRAGARVEEVAVGEEELASAQDSVRHARARQEQSRQLKAERLAKAETALDNAQAQLRFAERDAQRTQKLKEKGIVAEQRFEEAAQKLAARRADLAAADAEIRIIQANDLAGPAQELARARAHVDEARARLDLIRADARPEEIDAAEAVVAGLAAERVYIHEHLDLTVVRSPIRGIVTTPKPGERRGAFVEQGDLILEVYDLTVIKAEILVSEKEIGEVEIGQPVLLKARAYPKRDFNGTVEAIAPIAADDDGGLQQRVVRVVTAIRNPDLLLKPGMTGHGKITCCKRRVFDLITRRLVRYIRVEFWSWW